MKKFTAFFLLVFLVNCVSSRALNVTIIASSPTYAMDSVWYRTCLGMGHTVAIYPDTKLDLIGNLSTTDILIVASALDPNLDVARTAVIKQYLLNGGKAYVQSEYDSTFTGNIAYESLVNSLGGYFRWTGIVQGVLDPMDILGSIATDYATTAPLPYFWWGQTIDPCSSVEMFLEYQGGYFGSIFCVPSSSGRVITVSDQDWINGYAIYPETDSLMKNIIYNLAKTSYNCVNSGGGSATVNLGNDTTICSGNYVILNAGPGYSSYLWQNGETTSSIFVTSTGTYSVKVSSPCVSGTDSINVNVVTSPPTPDITKSNDTLFCSFDTSYSSYQWYDDTTLVQGGTNPFLVISHGGNYNVKVTNKNGCSIAVGISVSVGIKNYFIENVVSLSPNPATDRLLVNGLSDISGDVTITIFNTIGEKVLSSTLPNGEGGREVSIKSLSAGTYFVQLTTENKRWMARFVKQ